MLERGKTLRKVIGQCIKEGKLHEVSMDEEHGLEEEIPCGFFYDLEAYDKNVNNLIAAFPKHFLHASAIKSNPLTWFIKYLRKRGLGVECASPEEVFLAKSGGVPCQNIIFDSPVKSYSNIKSALISGIHLNIDNYQELEIVSSVLESLTLEEEPSIGLRINPLLGLGAIEALSVSTPKSKFGVPLPNGEILSEEEMSARQQLLLSCVQHTFVSCIHVHCGSGGMGVTKLCIGVKAAVQFALEVNELRRENNCSKMITCLDIGGGIAANFDVEPKDGFLCRQSNAFAYYANELKESVPELFDESIFSRVITEFGASLNLNFCDFISRVEYTKVYQQHNIICLHGGSDLFLRQAYSRKSFAKNSVGILDLDSKFVWARYNKEKADDTEETYDFVGPLCFAGDIIINDVYLPKGIVSPNDFAIIFDVGANSFSLKNMHCSKLLPPVYGYRVDKEGNLTIEVIKKKQGTSHLLQLWT